MTPPLRDPDWIPQRAMPRQRFFGVGLLRPDPELDPGFSGFYLQWRIHRERFNGCPADAGLAVDHRGYLVTAKMCVPILASRIEKRDCDTRLRVSSRCLCPLLAVAVPTAEGKIIVGVASTADPRRDVLQMKCVGADPLGRSAIFAA